MPLHGLWFAISFILLLSFVVQSARCFAAICTACATQLSSPNSHADCFIYKLCELRWCCAYGSQWIIVCEKMPKGRVHSQETKMSVPSKCLSIKINRVPGSQTRFNLIAFLACSIYLLLYCTYQRVYVCSLFFFLKYLLSPLRFGCVFVFDACLPRLSFAQPFAFIR